jgi:ribosome-binding factor A
LPSGKNGKLSTKAMPKSAERINELIKSQIAAYLQRQTIADDVLITVSNVDSSPDLNKATIHITAFPSDNEISVLRKLRKLTSEISNYLLSNTSLRKIPKLSFRIDQGEKKVREIEEILEIINKQRKRNNG